MNGSVEEREEQKDKERLKAEVETEYVNDFVGAYDEFGYWHDEGFYDRHNKLIVGYYDCEGRLHQGFYNGNGDWIEQGRFGHNGCWQNYCRRRLRH